MRINNLDFSYDNKQIFHDYSLDLSDGITCLMGASGKGKTTLLKLMAGLLKPDNGKYHSCFRKTVCCPG